MGVSRDLFAQLGRWIEPLKVRVANSIARGVVKRVDDSLKRQIVQLGVLEGELVDDGEHFQPFGFKSVPEEGAEAVAVFPNGDRGHPLVVVVDDRRRRPVGWLKGESGLYNSFGAVVRLKADGAIEVTSGGSAVPLATKADLDALKAAITAWTPSANDGGAALRTKLTSDLFPSWPIGTSKLKAE